MKGTVFDGVGSNELTLIFNWEYQVVFSHVVRMVRTSRVIIQFLKNTKLAPIVLTIPTARVCIRHSIQYIYKDIFH